MLKCLKEKRLVQGRSLSFTNLTKTMIGVNVGDWHYFNYAFDKRVTPKKTDWVDFKYINRR